MGEKHFFSASCNAFFPENLKRHYEAAGSWPEDALAVSPEVFNEFALSEPPAGQARGSGADGAPVWVEAPVIEVPLAQSAATALAEARAHVWAEYASVGEAVPEAWCLYQKQLKAIVDGTETAAALPAAPDAEGAGNG